MRTRNLVILISLAFWPIGLFLANTKSDFINYLLPTLLVGISFFISYKKNKLYPVPLLIVPFIEPKLALLPISIILADLLFFKDKTKHIIVFLLIATLIFAINFKSFKGQTVFLSSNNDVQKVIQKSQLYPTVFLARTFQNKPRIIIDKIVFNFFALTDPNNYFFGFHPRENPIENQNLTKYPFPSFILFFTGAFLISKSKFKKEIVIFLGGSIVALVVLQIFDRQDFILWIPLSVILCEGAVYFQKKYL